MLRLTGVTEADVGDGRIPALDVGKHRPGWRELLQWQARPKSVAFRVNDAA